MHRWPIDYGEAKFVKKWFKEATTLFSNELKRKIFLDFDFLQWELTCDQKGEEKFILLEKRAADIGIEIVGKVVDQVTQSTLEDLRFVTERR